jgi:hypothetical protein
MNQTRITIGVGEVNPLNAQAFHSNQPQHANLRATQQIMSPQHYMLQD